MTGLVLVGVLGFAVWRYGVAAVCLFLAPLFTGVAVFRNGWLVGVDPHSVVYAWLMMPWTLLATLTWALLGLSILTMALGAMPKALGGKALRN